MESIIGSRLMGLSMSKRPDRYPLGDLNSLEAPLVELAPATGIILARLSIYLSLSYSGGDRRKGGSPWEGTSGFHGKLADYVPLTEVGYEFPFKKALLARYRPDAALPAGKQTTLTASEELMRGIWVAEPMGPVSFEPFNEEEQKAVSTGNFCNFHKRIPPGGNANATGGHRYNRQQQAQPQQQYQQEKTLQPGQPPAQKQQYHPHQQHNEEEDYFARRRRPEFMEEERPKGRSLMSETRRRELAAEKTRDKALEERFNAPLNSRKGNPTGSMAEPIKVSKIVGSLSDLDDDGDMLTVWADRKERKERQGEIQDDSGIGRPVVIESAFARTAGRSVEPSVFDFVDRTPFDFVPKLEQPAFPAYQQPQYQQQQPSPINRQSSPTIHATTQWLYRDPAGQLQGPFTNAKMLDWYHRQYFPETLPLRRQEDALFMPLSEWKQKYGGKAPFETALVEPALDLSRSVELGTASSPLASFFDLNLNLAQPMNTGNTSTTSSAKALSEEESRFLSQLGLFSINDKPPASVPVQAPAISAPVQAAPAAKPAAPLQPAGPAWGAVAPVLTAKLDEIVQAKPAPKPAPVPAQRPLVPASSSGWCKPASPTTARPLEEILAEEERQAAARPKQTSNAPKSFADLMKGSPPASTPTMAPVQQGKPGFSPKPTVVPSAATRPNTSAAAAAPSLAQWAQETLRPLAPLYDIDTCVSLILALPSPEETVSFIRANIRTDRINMESFIHNLLQRRWGPAEAQKFSLPSGGNSGATTSISTAPFADEEFVTVDRRKPNKK